MDSSAACTGYISCTATDHRFECEARKDKEARSYARDAAFAYVCPVCKRGSAEPFRCGGPHPRPKRKRLYYDFVDAVEVRRVDA